MKTWKEPRKQEWQCPAKVWGAGMQHRKTTEQVWVMTLTNFYLWPLLSLIIVIFFRFIVVFQTVSALYKCSVCFSRKSQNKQAKKLSQKYNPKAGNYILEVGMAKLCLLRLLSYSQPCIQKGGSKQSPCFCGFSCDPANPTRACQCPHTPAGNLVPAWAAKKPIFLRSCWKCRANLVWTPRLPSPRKGFVLKWQTNYFQTSISISSITKYRKFLLRSSEVKHRWGPGNHFWSFWWDIALWSETKEAITHRYKWALLQDWKIN